MWSGCVSGQEKAHSDEKPSGLCHKLTVGQHISAAGSRDKDRNQCRALWDLVIQFGSTEMNPS